MKDPHGLPDQGGESSRERTLRLQTPVAAYPDDAATLASSFVTSFDLHMLSMRFKSAVAEASDGNLTATGFDAFRVELRERLEFSEIEPEILINTNLSTAQKTFLTAAGFPIKH